MTLREQSGQDIAQCALLIEEADAADADRVIPAPGERGHQIGCVEDEGALRRRLTAREARREQPGVRPRRGRCGQESGEYRLVRRIGEIAGGMTPLPSALRQMRREIGQATRGGRLDRDVVAQGVEGEQQQIVAADHLVHIGPRREQIGRHHGAPPFAPDAPASTGSGGRCCEAVR